MVEKKNELHSSMKQFVAINLIIEKNIKIVAELIVEENNELK